MAASELNPVGGASYPAAPYYPPTRPIGGGGESRPVEHEQPLPAAMMGGKSSSSSTQPLPLDDARGEIENLNKIMEGIGGRLEFGFYEDTEQFYVQLVDRKQGKVVKMMPPEYLLELKSRIQNAVGLILDEKS